MRGEEISHSERDNLANTPYSVFLPQKEQNRHAPCSPAYSKESELFHKL